MPVRTTQDQVTAICKVRAGDDLTPFIEVANGLVTEFCAGKYDDGWLEQIERWLSAHFYRILAPSRLQENAGSVGQQIESKVDLGLDVTRYGQQAKILDWQGGLARLNAASLKGALRAKIRWVGTPAGE